jgi:hypothetical protein
VHVLGYVFERKCFGLCWNKFLHASHIYCYLERMFMKLQELGTDTNLYALVFGESVLNDAVCRNFSLPHTHFFNFFSTDAYKILGTLLWSVI